MATSPNYSWPEPDNTDLVKNGALAIRTMGNAIDTTMATMTPKSTYTAKGSIAAATAASTPANLAVGNNGETLVADSTTTTGLRYQATYAAGKNKIINGACTIDQRNAGATSTGSGVYTVDRFQFNASQATKFTWGQNYGGVTPPAGYSNYLGFKTTTAVTIGAGDYFFFGQKIEGYNTADLAWGTASAKTVTFSFWVYSSLTGTFGGALQNSANNRGYQFSYTISNANTWEQKSITITGDTTGTWLNTSGNGVIVWLGLGVGSTYSGTAGSWNTNNAFSATGATSVVGTLNATFYTTGWQFEIGSVNTGFALSTGTISGELVACQRYYFRWTATDLFSPFSQGISTTTTNAQIFVQYPVTMRTKPNVLEFSTLVISDIGSYNLAISAITLSNSSLNVAEIGCTNAATATANRAAFIRSNNSASGYLAFGAEL